MTLTLDLTPAEEARLTTAARQAGVAPTALLKKFVDSLPGNPPTMLPETKVRQQTKQETKTTSQGRARGTRRQEPVAAETGQENPPSLRGLGMFAHVPGGAEQYAQEKQAQIIWEERPRA